MIPEGWVLIDTARSFVYAESGLKGVLMASRLSELSPNLTFRFTSRTLISSYSLRGPEKRCGRAFQKTVRREHQLP